MHFSVLCTSRAWNHNSSQKVLSIVYAEGNGQYLNVTALGEYKSSASCNLQPSDKVVQRSNTLTLQTELLIDQSSTQQPSMATHEVSVRTSKRQRGKPVKGLM